METIFGKTKEFFLNYKYENVMTPQNVVEYMPMDTRGMIVPTFIMMQLKHNTIQVPAVIRDETCRAFVDSLLLMSNRIGHDKVITLNIDTCYGGAINAGMAMISNLLVNLKNPIKIILNSGAYSFGSVIMSMRRDIDKKTEEAKRLMHHNARIMIHSPRSVFGFMDYSDIMQTAKNFDKCWNNLMNYYEQMTEGKLNKKIITKETKDGSYDWWINSADCLKYGLVDAVINPFSGKLITDVKEVQSLKW